MFQQRPEEHEFELGEGPRQELLFGQVTGWNPEVLSNVARLSHSGVTAEASRGWVMHPFVRSPLRVCLYSWCDVIHGKAGTGVRTISKALNWVWLPF